MKLDFGACAALFTANTTEGEALRTRWGWHGKTVGLFKNEHSQISHEGCLQLCGPGIDIPPWAEISNTITTTGLLPVFSTLLQAPFESNAAVRTLLAIRFAHCLVISHAAEYQSVRKSRFNGGYGCQIR
jgi:hypothetical protein